MKKRIYIQNAPYFLTTNPRNRFPFFEEDIFCNILIDVIAKVQKIKPFELIGFKINPDHIHIILQPTDDFNISQIMHSIKRVSSDQINQIIHYGHDNNPYQKLAWDNRLSIHSQCFFRKNNYQQFHRFPKFKWQANFDDQLIRTSMQLHRIIEYTKNQSQHHELNENKFLFINPKMPSNLNFIGLEN